MRPGQAQSGESPRPWYYQNWFLIASFVLGWPLLPEIGLYFSVWPAWAFLIIRSPWHTTYIFRALAWSMIITGGILMILIFSSEATPEAPQDSTSGMGAEGTVETEAETATQGGPEPLVGTGPQETEDIETEAAEGAKIRSGPDKAISTLLPGALLTVLTQVMWARQKAQYLPIGNPPGAPATSTGPMPSPTRPVRPRRRVRRRRTSRHRRSPRQPP